MGFPAGPWLRAVLWWQNQEQEWQNDIWFKVTGTISPSTNVDTVATDLDAALNALLIAVICPDAFYIGLDAYLNNGTYTVKGQTNGNTAGNATGDALPTENAAIVTLNAGIGTREGVGRIFFSGVPENFTTESKLNSSGHSGYNDVATALKGITTAGGVPIELAMWSRKAGAIEKVSFTEVSNLIGHRSKRKPRR